MRTTVNIDDALLRRAKRVAAETDRSLGRVIEDALHLALVQAAEDDESGRFEFPTYGGGGTRPGVNLDSNAELLDLMEEGLPIDKRR